MRARGNERAMRRFAPLAATTAIVLACAGCMEPDRTAQWYMAHGDELQSKLLECKRFPTLNESDSNCKAASDAFATLLAATQNAKPASSNAR